MHLTAISSCKCAIKNAVFSAVLHIKCARVKWLKNTQLSAYNTKLNYSTFSVHT